MNLDLPDFISSPTNEPEDSFSPVADSPTKNQGTDVDLSNEVLLDFNSDASEKHYSEQEELEIKSLLNFESTESKPYETPLDIDDMTLPDFTAIGSGSVDMEVNIQPPILPHGVPNKGVFMYSN
jgi:hypothetical protein